MARPASSGAAARMAAFPQRLAARVSALPRRRQELLADSGIAVALAAVNAVSLLPYRTYLHPFWLAITLVVAQAIPLAWRRTIPVGTGLIIGAARIAYDKIGFGYAPFPLGPAIAVYTIFDRRGPVWRWITVGIIAAGIAISESAPGHSEPYDAIFQVLIFLTAWVAGTVSRAKRASLAAAESRADRAEAEADRQAALAAAAERTRIARELHDIVAHHVSLMAVQAEAATSLLPGRPAEAQRSVEVIGNTARAALAELRRLLGVLRGPSDRAETMPQATLSELDGLLEQVRSAGLAVDFDVVGTPFPLAPGIELTAHRIIQEALTNTLRHANASHAAVLLSYEPGHITIGVADSGPRLEQLATGSRDPGVLEQEPALAGTGFGLAGITERVASCGGSLTVGPTQPDGFAVTARLPAR